MTPLFLDPSLFRKRLSLQEAVLTPDGAGGASEEWVELREISAHVEPVATRDRERFDSREATITHRVICRATPEVTRGRSFMLGARRLVIRSVHDPDETGRFLVCRCEEAA
ncbi:phage head closure protein [Aurantimonas aggregata]|uniref:Phage head closure protein n=1 Tax=Aurantimonas aggregata TaxID=2047720 RepID=A0A6L9MJG9_9HYPH|nr:phage head closure protein [Aurantimonas aggregata]NDV87772.1 phage head closure protein [Aurantimonas aggregata]